MKTKPRSELSANRVVGTSFAISIADVVLNLIVAIVTNSTVMLSQSLQGLSDLATAGILFTGIKRSKRRSDDNHPFGYGREVFFYVLLAGIFMFIGTGAMSVFIGMRQILDPHFIDQTWLALTMLSFGLLSNGYAFGLSARRLGVSLRTPSATRSIIRSSLVETKATFIIDLLGTLAAAFGLLALIIYGFTGNELFDGIGSVTIGLLMMVGASLLVFDAKDLIVGRSVPEKTMRTIRNSVTSHPQVQDVLDLRTMYLGSGRLLVIAEVHFQDNLTTDQIEQINDELKLRIAQATPIVDRVQIEAETPDIELND